MLLILCRKQRKPSSSLPEIIHRPKIVLKPPPAIVRLTPPEDRARTEESKLKFKDLADKQTPKHSVDKKTTVSTEQPKEKFDPTMPSKTPEKPFNPKDLKKRGGSNPNTTTNTTNTSNVDSNADEEKPKWVRPVSKFKGDERDDKEEEAEGKSDPEPKAEVTECLSLGLGRRNNSSLMSIRTGATNDDKTIKVINPAAPGGKVAPSRKSKPSRKFQVEKAKSKSKK